MGSKKTNFNRTEWKKVAEPNLKSHGLGYVWLGIDRIGYDKPKRKRNKWLIKVFLYTWISWIMFKN